MKSEIGNILKIWGELKTKNKRKIETENAILSFSYIINKGIAESDSNSLNRKRKSKGFQLINLEKSISNKVDKIGKLLVKLSPKSLRSGKLELDLLEKCIYNNVKPKEVAELKILLKSFNNSKFSNIAKNRVRKRVGKTYSDYFVR